MVDSKGGNDQSLGNQLNLAKELNSVLKERLKIEEKI